MSGFPRRARARLLSRDGRDSNRESALGKRGAPRSHTQIFDYECGTDGSRDRCDDGDLVPISTTGPLFCYRADLSQSEGSSALLAATSSDAYATKEEMGKACCGMTDYYVLTGNVFAKPSTFFADASTCDVAAHPANGAYASAACAPGSTLYSGNGCHVECDDGFTAAGVTRCVKGAFVEYATCESDDVPAPAPTATPDPAPTATPEPAPTATPEPAPTATPEPAPTAKPAGNSGPTCEDSTSWWYKKTKNTCEGYVAKKTKYCKEKVTSEDGVSSIDACPAMCGGC